MAGFTVTLIGVAAAGLLGVVHVHWASWVRRDQRLTKQSSNPEFDEQKGNVGSCPRILRVSFGFPRVSWHQNCQKHLPNIPPTSSQNSSQALPTSSLSSHAFQGLILRTYGENSWKKHGEPEEKNPHFLCTRLILDLQNYRGSWNQIYNITGAFCTALNVEAAVKVPLDARERSPCNPVIEIQHSTLQVSFKTRSRPTTTCLGVQSWCTLEPFSGHTKTAQQQTIIQQYGDRYTGRWWVTCGLLHLVQWGGASAGCGPAQSLLAVPNVTAHPSTTSVPTSYYSIWHYNYQCPLKS